MRRITNLRSEFIVVSSFLNYLVAVVFYLIFIKAYFNSSKLVTLDINAVGEADFELVFLAIILLCGFFSIILTGFDYLFFDESDRRTWVWVCLFGLLVAIFAFVGIIWVFEQMKVAN